MATYTAPSGETIYGGRFGDTSIQWDHGTDLDEGLPNQEKYQGLMPQDPVYDCLGQDYLCWYRNNLLNDGSTPANPSDVWVYLHASGGWDNNPPSYGNTLNGHTNISWVWTHDAQKYGYDEHWQLSGYDTEQGVSNYCGERMAAVLDSMEGYKTDGGWLWDRGIALYGTSMGCWGTGNQIFAFPARWKSRVVQVFGQIGHTYTRELGTHTYPGAQTSNPWTDTIGPTTDPAWDIFDCTIQIPVDDIAQNVVYQFMGNVRSNLGLLNPKTIQVYQENKVQAQWTWSGETHSLPLSASPLRIKPNAKNWFGKPFPAFTNSSGDWPHTDWAGVTVENIGLHGHVNLGLDWDWDNILEDASQIIIPIRYQQQTGFPEPVDTPPDMPATISVDVTVRRSALLADTTYAWSYGGQSGTAGTDGQGLLTVTIDMGDSASFTNLVVTK